MNNTTSNDNDNNPDNSIDKSIPEEHQHATSDSNNHKRASELNEKQREQLKNLYLTNYETFHGMSIDKHALLRNPNKRINKETLFAADSIVQEHITSLNNVSLWDINCSIYSMEISCKQLNGDIDVINNQRIKKEEPKWIMNLKNSIEKIRKLIAHTKVVIQCKKENHYMKHQEHLKIKLQKSSEAQK